MKQLTERQKNFLALGKRMKEVIQLSKDLASDGHPVINKWVDNVEEIVQKYSESHMLDNIWRYQDLPHKKDLFDILTYLRKILKAEGIFSQELVE